MADHYNSMRELKGYETDWSIETNQNSHPVLSIAPHGGGIECGTSELALLVSQKLNCNFFTFKGQLSSNNSRLHVTSSHYNDQLALALTKQVNYTISIHGYHDKEKESTYIGGTNEQLKSLIKKHLESRGFIVLEAPKNLAGKSRRNINNKNRFKSSVQLELSTKLRKSFFSNDDFSKEIREDRQRWRASIYEYAQAIEWAMKEYLDSK